MKILVLDVDQGHNKRIQMCLGSDSRNQVSFYEDSNSLLEVLNGLPQEEKAKVQTDKEIVDIKAMIAKTEESIKAIEKSKKDKLPPAEEKAISEKIKKAQEVINHLNAILNNKTQTLAEIQSRLLKPEEKKCHLVMVDRSFLGNKPKDWVTQWRNNIQLEENKNVPLVILGYNSDLEYIYSLLAPGVSDYFIKPVDLLLLKHNAARLGGKTLEAEEKIYEIETSAVVKVLRVAKVIRLSEFEMTAQVRSSFDKGEIVELFADVFDIRRGQRLLALCQSCEPDSKEAGVFNCRFSFIGLAPGIMNEIRKWIKKQYIINKNKEA